MVGGKGLALAEYARRRDSLAPDQRRVFTARHPILETAYRTAWKGLERAMAEKNDALRALAHLAHDINNPLTTLAATVDMLKMQADGSGMPEGPRREVVDQLSLLKDCCHRVLHITNSALELSSAETGRIMVDSTLFDATEQSERIVRHMGVLAKRKGLGLKFEGNGRVGVMSDHRLFDRVLSNILGNALKYTETGDVTVSVAREGGNATIRVRDTGPGIGNEELRAIFDEHYRGQSSNGIFGKGLGLYIAKTYTELMGGRIGVESEPGRGTVFTLTFRAEG